MANWQLTSYSIEKSESICSKIRNKTRMPTLALCWILFHSKHKRLKLKKTGKFLFFPPWNCFLDPLCLLWNLRIWVKIQNITLSCALSKTLTRSIWSFDSGKLPIYTVSLIEKNEKKKKPLFKEETIFATKHYFYSLSKSAKSNVSSHVYTYENIVLSINSLRRSQLQGYMQTATNHSPRNSKVQTMWWENYRCSVLIKIQSQGLLSLPPRETGFFVGGGVFFFL